MFDDSFFPVAIFITVRPLSSQAREQSHSVSHTETLSEQLIWFFTEPRDCKFIMLLSAAAEVWAFHWSDQPRKQFLISSLIISLLSAVSTTPIKCNVWWTTTTIHLKLSIKMTHCECILSEHTHTPLYVQNMPAADNEPRQLVIPEPYIKRLLSVYMHHSQECAHTHTYTHTQRKKHTQRHRHSHTFCPWPCAQRSCSKSAHFSSSVPQCRRPGRVANSL